MIGGLAVDFTESFERDFDKLSRDIQDAVTACIEDLEKEPIPSKRRLHAVSPKGHKPTIYSVDIMPNKSYKLTFEIQGLTAVLRRVGTHSRIDRTP